MIKTSDYIAQFFAQKGQHTVYMITGGGAMHLNHSLGTHPQFKVIFNHHEQACAMAAESEARLTGKPAIVNVTTGPGGINTLNGVYGAYTDSIPMIVLSGQVRYDTTLASTPLPLRQLGDQEVDIISMVKPITKYAEMMTDPKKIKYYLEKAYYLATTGRPGPVWLDIPMNIQGGLIDPEEQEGFTPPTVTTPAPDQATLAKVIEKLQQAKRPVLFVGAGIRLSHSESEFAKLIDTLKIPVVTGWNAHDIIENDHPCFAGRPGTVGDRAGNFAVQNSDVLLVMGSRLNIRQVSYNWKSFAREAYKIMVDIDPAELQKPTLSIDLPIEADLKAFIPALTKALETTPLPSKSDWVDWCKARVKRYPTCLPAYFEKETPINPYVFLDELSRQSQENQLVVTANGTACVVAFQTWHIKKGQRLYTNSGSASMGYDLPAAIGACIGSNGQSVLCIAGDGSIQMNLQELATISYNKFPIKILWLNNNGYHSIRQTQRNFFGNFIGCDPESNLGFPNTEKIAHAFNLPYLKCDAHAQIKDIIAQVLALDGPCICEVFLDQTQDFSPKLSSKRLADGRMVSSPLEDLSPFLSREEFAENMIIPMQDSN